MHFDFLDSGTFPDALEGVTKVFFIRPPQLSTPKEDMFPFLHFLKAQSIAHVLFVSLIGVEKNPVTPHHKIEKEMVRLELPYTFLRPSFFMQNLNTPQHLQQKYSITGKEAVSYDEVADRMTAILGKK